MYIDFSRPFHIFAREIKMIYLVGPYTIAVIPGDINFELAVVKTDNHSDWIW